MTQFNLSEKINCLGSFIGCESGKQIIIHIEDVKEFIRLLKEELTPELFHNTYEQEARKSGWETHKNCINKSFDDLPETNQEAMINTINRIKEEIIDKLAGDKLSKKEAEKEKEKHD